MMKTIETTATVSAERTLTAWVPPDIPPGEYRVVLVIQEQAVPGESAPARQIPVIHVGQWAEGLFLRCEDSYGDWGR